MSASSPRSTASISAADALELDKTFWVDSLSASVRGGRTSASEDLARVLQSEREYWCRLCVQQVGEMEKAMQAKVEALEGRILERARESVGPLVDEAAGGLRAELRQEAEVQRAERESAAIQAAKAEAEARCSARLEVAEAAVRELRGELREALSERHALQDALQEQRRETVALSGRLERLEGQRPEQGQPATPPDAGRRGVDTSSACARTPVADSALPPLRSEGLALRGDAPERPAEAPAPAGAELPRLLGRGRSVSPARCCAKGALARGGLRGGGSPAGLPAIPQGRRDSLKDSLRQVVSAVQRTLDDFQEEPGEGAPRASEQPAPPPRARRPGSSRGERRRCGRRRCRR